MSPTRSQGKQPKPRARDGAGGSERQPGIRRQPRPHGGLRLRFVHGAAMGAPRSGRAGRGAALPPNHRTRPRRALVPHAHWLPPAPQRESGAARCSPHRIPQINSPPPFLGCQSFTTPLSWPRICNSIAPRRRPRGPRRCSPCTQLSFEAPWHRGSSPARRSHCCCAAGPAPATKQPSLGAVPALPLDFMSEKMFYCT